MDSDNQSLPLNSHVGGGPSSFNQAMSAGADQSQQTNVLMHNHQQNSSSFLQSADDTSQSSTANHQPLLDFTMQLDNANTVIPDAIALYYLRQASGKPENVSTNPNFVCDQ